MAAGEDYINCTSKNLSAEAAIKAVIVEDSNGKPAIRIYEESSGGSVFPNPVVVTVSITRPTTSGSVTAGKRKIDIANVGSGDGSVLLTTLKSGESITLVAGMYDLLPAIAYDATGTEFLITNIS